MKKAPSHLLTALLAVAVVLLIPRVGETGETGARAEITRSEETLRAMITALLANDYSAFLSQGSKGSLYTTHLKPTTTYKPTLYKTSRQFSPDIAQFLTT